MIYSLTLTIAMMATITISAANYDKSLAEAIALDHKYSHLTLP